MGKKHITKIAEVAPDLAKDAEIQDAAENLEQAEDLASILTSQGGKALVNMLAEECVSALRVLIESYKTVSHAELMGLVAKYEAHYNVLATIKNSPAEAKDLQAELDTLIVNKHVG